jgi:hypothetical protein
MACKLPAGSAQDELRKKVRNSEEAVRMCGWLNSKELKPPTKQAETLRLSA